MPERAVNGLKLAASVAAFVALLALIHLGWKQVEIARSLHRVWHLPWLLAAVIGQLLVYLCIAGMFRLSLGTRYSLKPQFLVYCAFAFLFANRSLPGPAIAGVATLVYLMREKGVPSVDAQASAGAFYFADYAGFFTLIVAVSVPLFVYQPDHATRLAYLVSLCIIAVTAVAAVISFANPLPLVTGLKRSANMIESWLKPDRPASHWGATLAELVINLRDKIIQSGGPPASLLGYFFLAVLMHVSEVATVLCGAYACGVPLSVAAGAASYVAGNLASIISVLPGAVGFYEAGMIGTMHLVGHLSIGDSAVCALTYRLLSFWAPLPAVMNVLLKVSRAGLLRSQGHGAVKLS